MVLHPLIQAYVNSDERLSVILEKNLNKEESLEVAFLAILNAQYNHDLDQIDPKLQLEIDEAIVKGHPDTNVYLLFIVSVISHSSNVGQFEKAKSLYSIVVSILNENIHPIIQALCMQAAAQINVIGGNYAKFHQLMKQSISIIDRASPRYKRVLINYSTMLATEGLLYDLEKLDEDILNSNTSELYAFFIADIKLINYVMIGEYNKGINLIKEYQKIDKNQRRANNLDASINLFKIISGDFNEASYKFETTKYFVRSLNCILALKFKEASEASQKVTDTFHDKLMTGKLEEYLPLHIELCLGNKGKARLLLKEKSDIGKWNYMDDLFYGRLHLLEKNFDAADICFSRLIENVNRYGAMGRLNFELQFAKEMKLSDVLFLLQGWKKPKKKLPVKELPVKEKVASKKGNDLLVGNSQAINQVKELVNKYASLKVPVLVTGETGTGKELVSRAIHDAGQNPQAPFLAINCGALSESLLQSELFGYVAGAFTGAQKERQGIFEAAGKGTVFLDEFGDISPQLQVSLLRVLESNEIRMLGGTVTRKVECRIVIATNVDLQKAVVEKKFREDLFFRITRFEIKIPALRERTEDLPLLIDYFLNMENKTPKKVSNELLEALSIYRWPGNIRELKNEMDRLNILHADKELINKEDFDFNHLQGYLEASILNTTKPQKILEQTATQSLPRGLHEQSVTSEMVMKVIQRGSKTDRRHSFIKELFKQYKTLTRSQVIEITDVSPSTATKELQILCDEGFILRREPTSSPRTFYFEINAK